ncbi:MAG: hypothetical protein V4449_02335 [Patescibacteria group bacterium]
MIGEGVTREVLLGRLTKAARRGRGARTPVQESARKVEINQVLRQLDSSLRVQ